MLLTKTEETKKQYLDRVKRLSIRAKKELDIPSYENFPIKQFVGWLIANQENWSRNTFKEYRASVYYYLELCIENGDKSLIEIYDVLKERDLFKTNLDKKANKRTSGKKQKNLPINDFLEIINFIERGKDGKSINSKFNESLYIWLHAGILTGLRPNEWSDARIEDNKLIVRNSKHTNGRSFGEFRTIHLNLLTEKEFNFVKKQVENGNYYNNLGKYQYFYKSCSDLLRDIGKKLWSNRKQYPSLYTLRHQFSADAKASGLSEEEIAALMGHIDKDMAKTHYAKKRFGQNLCKITPFREDVLKVKQALENKLSVNLKNKI